MHTLTFGAGSAQLDAATGAPVSLRYGGTARRYLLDPDLPWNTVIHRWGSGSVVTDLGAARWGVPAARHGIEGGEELVFDLAAAGLALTVERTAVGGKLIERYVWRNVADRPVTITGLAVETPFDDWYPGGMRALDECVNAHVFAGGAWSWVLAEPMSGTTAADPALGLIVREGAVNAYAIASRNEKTSSNVRGHITLCVTDRATNPDAFGGQPAIGLAPGATVTLAWELGWYASRDAFLADTRPMASLSAYAVTVGDPIEVTTKMPVRCIAAALPAYAAGRTPAGGPLEAPLPADLAIAPAEGGWRVSSAKPGAYTLAIGGADSGVGEGRVEILVHDTLERTVRAVCGYVLAHHRPVGRPGTLADAIVPADTRTGQWWDDGGWADWSDGSERMGMAVLLQKAINRGWVGVAGRLPEARAAADAWRAYCLEWLVDDTYATRRGSSQPEATFGERIYDMPWMAEFFCDHYDATGDPEDLDVAVGLMERMADLGGERFLTIGFGEVSSRLAALLRAAGRGDEADSIERHVVASADHFLGLGRDLPDHEVAYEQSITAPLVNLFIEAHRITGEERFLDGVRMTLPWLLAFGGPQPSVRLHGIGIRHWDGYWFGIDRQFGDVFPHYWSALTATVLARLPHELRDERTDALALAILRANLANVNPDGSGTCAYLFPSSVDGRATHRADPLSNDQNWALSIWLRLMHDEGVPGV